MARRSPNALVTFATDNTLAVFTPSAGVALTDASGVASIAMRPFSLAAGGAAKVTATAIVAGATVTAETNYSVGATELTLSPIASVGRVDSGLRLDHRVGRRAQFAARATPTSS